MNEINKLHRQQGFTMLEFLVAVAIIGITTAVGFPSYQTFITNNRLTASANDMLTALQVARSEAIKQVKKIGVVIDTPTSTWAVYDPATATHLQEYSASTGVTITVTGSSIAMTPNYRPDGRLEDNQAITMVFKASGSTEQRILTIQLSGRVAVTNPDA